TKISLIHLYTNRYHILLCLSFTMFINMLSFGQDLPKKGLSIKPKTKKDSVTVSVDTLLVPKVTQEIDSVKQDSLKPKNEFLTDIVTYKATDYTSFNRKEQRLYLYNNAEVYYEDMEIKAGQIIIDYSKNEVYAKGIVDSTGAYLQRPVFVQGANTVEPDSLRFNTDTQRSLIYNSFSEQGDGWINSNITKKENDSVYFVKNAKYSTAEDKEDPEYYILMRKAKIVPRSKVVTGLANLFIYNVPT